MVGAGEAGAAGAPAGDGVPVPGALLPVARRGGIGRDGLLTLDLWLHRLDFSFRSMLFSRRRASAKEYTDEGRKPDPAPARSSRRPRSPPGLADRGGRPRALAAVLPRADVPGLDRPVRAGAHRPVQRLAPAADGDRPPSRLQPRRRPRAADAGAVRGRSVRPPGARRRRGGAALRRPRADAPGGLDLRARARASADAGDAAGVLPDDVLEGFLGDDPHGLDRRPGARPPTDRGHAEAAPAGDRPRHRAGDGAPQRGRPPAGGRPGALGRRAAGAGGEAGAGPGGGPAGALSGRGAADRPGVRRPAVPPRLADPGARPGGLMCSGPRRRPSRLPGAPLDAGPHPRRERARRLPAGGHRVHLLGPAAARRSVDPRRLPPPAGGIPAGPPRASGGAAAGEAGGVRDPAGARSDLLFLPRFDRRQPLPPGAGPAAGAGAVAPGAPG